MSGAPAGPSALFPLTTAHSRQERGVIARAFRLLLYRFWQFGDTSPLPNPSPTLTMLSNRTNAPNPTSQPSQCPRPNVTRSNPLSQILSTARRNPCNHQQNRPIRPHFTTTTCRWPYSNERVFQKSPLLANAPRRNGGSVRSNQQPKGPGIIAAARSGGTPLLPIGLPGGTSCRR